MRLNVAMMIAAIVALCVWTWQPALASNVSRQESARQVDVAEVVAAKMAWPARPDQLRPASATKSASGAAAVSVMSMLNSLRLFNYYPANNGWSYMWTRWNPTQIDSDFARIAALHGNAVRVILQANTLGYPQPTADMLNELSTVVSLAHGHALAVQLTLFDWWSGYTDISGSEQWARAVVAPFAGDPRIAFIELQNEIAPSNVAAMSWAQHLIPYLHSIDGGIPVTVSVTGAASNLSALKSALGSSQPDFYDFHYYGYYGTADSTFRQSVQAVAPLPLYIGETGYSTLSSNAEVGGLPLNSTAQEAYQDLYLRGIEYAAGAVGLPPAAPWTLRDFSSTAIPGGAAASEYYFGLERLDGSLKPAAASLSAIMAASAPSLALNNSFEANDGSLPTDWLVYHASEAHFSIDTTMAHSGAASARISQSSGDALGVPAFYTTPVNAAVSAGQQRTLSAWVRGSNATGNTRLGIAWFGADGTYLGQAESPSLPLGTTTWKLLSVTGTAPQGTAYAQIHLKSSYNSGSAWFDDVSYT